MNSIQLKARAKINLSLDILGKRPDGYHEVEMIMQSIELHDLIHLEAIDQGIQVITDHPLLNAEQENIAYKSARLLMERYHIDRGVKITITKNIPVAAGLAGGSSDAAAVLKGLRLLWNLHLTQEQLEGIGSEIGSDVPFCIKGGTVLATGRGEVLTPLEEMPEVWLVLAKPPIEVSTAEVYKNFSLERVNDKPQTALLLEAIKQRDINSIANHMGNVLETVTLNRYPTVLALKKAMTGLGLKAMMSGSGPSVFGFATGHQEAEKIAGQLRDLFPDTFITVTRTSGAA